MKKIINNNESYVLEMLQGFAKTTKEIGLLEKYLILYCKNNDKNKVNLISGGGSGHEPAHGGFIGQGMLMASVSGHIFSSPTVEQVQMAIKQLDAQETLLIIKNYTGDVLNFKIAAELAKAESKKVDFVIVDDDVAVQNSTWTDGKRGVAGTIFVHKIAGAAAEEGKSLVEVKAIAQKVIKNLFSIGIGLESGVSPITGKPSFDLSEQEYEFGIGIHGEPGIEKHKITTSQEMTKQMLDKIFRINDLANSEVALLVNGMGGTPLSELYIATNDILNYLQKKNIKVYISKVGNYMTSLDMKGFSISLLKLDQQLKKLLDKPTSATAW